MALRETELYRAMEEARDEYNKARRELAEFAARIDREMIERAEHVEKYHRKYKAAWSALREEKHRAFIAELEAVVYTEEGVTPAEPAIAIEIEK